jgi:hypothetical protein
MSNYDLKRCRKCSECDGNHHFSTVVIGIAEDEPQHPAALAGLPAWYRCKHCDAWTEDAEEDDFEVHEYDPRVELQ